MKFGWYLVFRNKETDFMETVAEFTSYTLALECAEKLNANRELIEFGVTDNPMIWKINK